MHNRLDAVRGPLLQTDRLIKLDTPLGPNVLVPQRVVGYSRLGRHFEFTADVVSNSDNIELKTLIAQRVTLWIQQSDKSYQPHSGYVHTARRLGSNGGLTTYQLSFASWMHFLKFRRDQRIWQEKTVEEIIRDVFNAHPQARGQFQFILSRPLTSRSYCRQDEDDWNFVHRLLETEGLYGFWRQAQDGQSHRLLIVDQLSMLDALSPKTVLFCRDSTASESDALVQWSGTRTLQSTALTTRTFDYKNGHMLSNPKGTSIPTIQNQGMLPSQTEVYEYTGAYTYSEQARGDQLSKIRMEEWESRAKRFIGAGSVRRLDTGRRFIFEDHPNHSLDQISQREFAVIETRWVIVNNLPIGSRGAAFPHSLQGIVDEARNRHSGDATCHTARTESSEGFYLVEIETQRTSIPFRSPFEHKKPSTHLESAIVVGPKGHEVYTDDLNRIKVQHIWDRLNGADEKSSSWVRVAQSDTGSGYGSVHVPRVGEEVLIDYIGGDCDRPVVVSRLYNYSATPQWHSNGLLSGYRSREYSGKGYNQLLMDDSTGQNRIHLYSSKFQSHLHLGYLVEQVDNSRGVLLGNGFDLKSDAYGAIRAGRGLFVSTHPTATSQPLDVTSTTEQLASAASVLELASQSSESSNAESLKEGHAALKIFKEAAQYTVAASMGVGGQTDGGGTGNANGFSTPIMLIASPAGIGVSTHNSVQLAANQHVNIVSGKNTHIAAGKSFIASVMEKISLFAQNAGVKLFAAKGKVEIQALGDAMALSALQDLTITSSAGKLILSADKEIWIGAGGSYIRITADKIENGTSGQILEKCASWDKTEAASMRMPAPLTSTTNGCTWKTAEASADSASSVELG